MSLGVERSEAGNKFQLILTKHLKEWFLNIVVQRVILNIFRKKGKNLKDIEIKNINIKNINISILNVLDYF